MQSQDGYTLRIPEAPPEGDCPIWDALIAERGGREPAQFIGWDTWEDSDEAKEAYQRGVDYAANTPAPWVASEPAVVAEPAKVKRRRKATPSGETN